MKPHVSMITLGVEDVKRSAEFYRRLGFIQRPNNDDENIVFFGLTSGLVLALYWREALAEDIRTDSTGDGFRGFTLAHNVASEEEVDHVLAEAVHCGAILIKRGEMVFWGGYSGYFADPDGFLWEVAYNPFMDLTG
jgi:predicted lactoylglutathione lyase